ncbi:MAG: lysophospholipase, partial [Lachnospiraceae bacterium]|nr:lysophospholipase [Lachnospiraceae bacterium]
AKNLEIPILILQGDADFQVYPDRDYAAWQVLLEGKSNVTFQLFEGLNHLFMLSDGTMNVTEYDTKAQVAPEVIDAIAAWMEGQ